MPEEVKSETSFRKILVLFMKTPYIHLYRVAKHLVVCIYCLIRPHSNPVWQIRHTFAPEEMAFIQLDVSLTSLNIPNFVVRNLEKYADLQNFCRHFVLRCQTMPLRSLTPFGHSLARARLGQCHPGADRKTRCVSVK